jgi:hypothetical protein
MLKAVRGSALLCLLSASFVQGAEPASPAGAEPVQQVTVEATRENLAKLGKEVLDAEALFYGRYNELNKTRKYAVNCYKEPSTGTRFTRRYCEPVFQNEAQLSEARSLVMGLQVHSAGSGNPGAMAAHGGAPPSIAGGMPSMTVKSVIEQNRPGFRKNMIEITRNSPELTRMAGDYAALVKRWSEMYRQVNGASSLPEEKNTARSADSK